MRIDTIKNEILELLSSSPSAVNLNSISKSLAIKSDSEEYEMLKELLDNLADEGILEKSSRRRYSLKSYDNYSTLEGQINISFGKGTLETKNPELPIVVIKRSNLFTALHNDVVKVQLFAQRHNKKPRGEVIEIVKRNRSPIVGSIEYDGEFYFLVPDEDFYYIDFLIPKNKLNNAKPGDKVACNFLLWENPAKSPQVEVIDILGRSGELNAEFDGIVKEFNLSEEFPDEVVKEANKLRLPTMDELKNRMDITEMDIITIDPEDAKDFDDALSLEILENGNYYLGVHIADVSHYVTENSELDIEARFRGNSTYLVDRVVPMLPENISYVLCSLMPNANRLAYSVFMEIGPRGAVQNFKIAETVINSKRRFNYEEVFEIIQTGQGDYSELIMNLHKLSQMLKKKRFMKGGINFMTSEVKFELDEDKNPISTKLKTTTDSTSLVEECMLICNKVVAEHIDKLSNKYKTSSKLPFLYRVHDAPDPKRISEVFDFISRFGIKLKAKNPDSKQINSVLDMFAHRTEKDVVNQVLIRSMAKAVYSKTNIGHYGLGFDKYSHFTSPIRRYPDLAIHRMLKEYALGKPNKDRLEFLKIFAKDASESSSNTERLSMEAERASVKLAHAILTEKHIGEEYEGTISGVTSFGVYVILDTIHSEGLVHIKDLRDDYYTFDEKNMQLIGKRHKRKFTFGDRIKVKIKRVNVKKRQIDFSMVE